MQQHVHARQVVGGDVLLLPDDLADAVRAHAVTHIEQQRARTAGKVEDAVNGELVSLEQNIEMAREKHNTFLKELGLSILP